MIPPCPPQKDCYCHNFRVTCRPGINQGWWQLCRIGLISITRLYSGHVFSTTHIYTYDV